MTEGEEELFQKGMVSLAADTCRAVREFVQIVDTHDSESGTTRIKVAKENVNRALQEVYGLVGEPIVQEVLEVHRLRQLEAETGQAI